NLISGYF
ncbi:hypothetical protein CP03DC29_1019B, partial [Chlamydia psittaci 03DC29]